MNGIENKEKNTIFGLKSISVEEYFVKQYKTLYNDMEIFPVDYIELKQIFETENKPLCSVKTLNKISELAGQKLLIENYPDPWELSGNLIALEQIEPDMLGQNPTIETVTENIKNYMQTGDLNPQKSLADFI